MIMKVAILSAGMPSPKYPLIGIFEFDQAKALVKAGLEVYFLSVDVRSARNKRKWGYSQGLKEGVKWYNFSLPIGPIPSIQRLFNAWVISFLYKKAFGNNKPDIIHAHFTGMGVLANIIKQKYGIPYVVTEHSSAINQKVIPYSLKQTALTSYKNAERVIAVSSALSSKMKAHTGVDNVVIPNIIDLSIFGKCIPVQHSGFRLVSTSNLIPLKRTKLILEAINQCKDRIQDIHLDVFGDGELKEELIDYTKANSIDHLVTFHGLKNREEIALAYQTADCFVLPSSTETFGVAYVEAMAAGMPVIATRCGGPEDFVDESNGVLVDVDNVEQLNNAIIFMYYHHNEYNKKSIKENVVNKYSAPVIAQQIISVYKEIF